METVHRTGRRLERLAPVGPWVVLAVVGSLLAAVALWHYWREIRAVGLGIGPIVAAALGVSLSTGVVYAALRLRTSDLHVREGWLVVGAGLGGGLFTGLTHGVTMAVRAIEGRPLPESTFPLLVTASVGILGGVVIGSEHARTRRLTEQTRERSDAIAFTNRLLRHDVRNALQIIDGHATVLARSDDDQIRESAETIRGQTHSLERIVTEVESVVEVLTGDQPGETADAGAVLDDAVTAVATDQAGVTVETDVGSTLPVEGGDALYPVFSNVVGNAVEHGSKNPDAESRNDASGDADANSVRIRVTAEREDAGDGDGSGGRAVVRVADDGPGVPPPDHERVFERGVSSDGGGHGLYVAQTVVERLGGDVRVEESDLGGAAFVVEVPLAESATGSDGGSAVDPDSGPAAGSDGWSAVGPGSGSAAEDGARPEETEE